MTTPTWVIVATKNRNEMVCSMLASLADQVTGAVIIDNNDVPMTDDDISAGCVHRLIHLHHPGYPPNLSAMLNTGIDALDNERAPSTWNIAVMNDDVTCPPGWIESLDSAMRGTSAVLAYTDRLARGQPVLYTTPPMSPFDTCTVWACILRGEAVRDKHIRFDETMKWWYSDTDLDYQCRQLGGVLAVPGTIPTHHHPSAQTVSDAVLTAQTHRDREAFAAKWNGAPW